MSRKKTQKKKEIDVNLFVFSNETEDNGTVQLLQMFYRGAFANSVGIMRALNTETNKVESVLIGVEIVGGKSEFYPLARVLEPDEATKYLAPNGKGGWFGREEA